MPNLSASLTQLERSLISVIGIEVARGVSTSEFTSMAVGGPADLVVDISSAESLARATKIFVESRMPWMILGGGSNTIFQDEGYRGALVRMKGELTRIEVLADEHLIRAGAGANVSRLMQTAKRAGLSGLEFFAGIPGTLGGALAGNSGAGGDDVCSVASWVELLGSDGKIERLERGDFSYGYRKSSLRDRIILGAGLTLTPDITDAIQSRIDAHLGKRMEQPLREQTSGCMFKNPPGDFAGRLIDQAELKNVSVGGISVSGIHANFMVNSGAGTADDIARLLELVAARVSENSGVRLETEVRLINATHSL